MFLQQRNIEFSRRYEKNESVMKYYFYVEKAKFYGSIRNNLAKII